MIKLLDCTLRDGGYIINRAFGSYIAKNIIQKLYDANIDYIELGFLKNNKEEKQTTVFLNLNEAKSYIKGDFERYTLMIKQGEFDVDKLPFNNKDKINLRYIFKKSGAKKAFDDSKKIISKGYKLFINPVFIEDYSNLDEFYNLISNFAKLNPKAISVVDSIGAMTLDDTLEIYEKLNCLLNYKIGLCFHFHNNSEYAFINAKKIIKLAKNSKREIIIDCCTSGMGRGAGNLATELISLILEKYNVSLIESIIDKELDEFYKKTPRGNSFGLYLASKSKVHPDYATYLINENVDERFFKKIFDKIPNSFKSTFNKELIKELSVDLVKNQNTD